MMKRNAIARTLIASAVLAVVGVAQAGSLTVTKRTVANEVVIAAATVVHMPNVTYTFNTPGGIVVNPSGAVQLKFVMTGGTWSTSGAIAAGNVVIASLPAGLLVDVITNVPTINTAGDTLTVSVSNTSTANVTIGIGGTVTLTNVSGATLYQAVGVTSGTPVTVTGGVYNGVNVLEQPTAASTAVDFAQAVTLGFTASTETTRKIDLTASPAGSALSASSIGAGPGLVQLGKIKATNATTAPVDANVSGTLTETSIVANSVAFNGAGHVVTLGVSSGSLTAKQGFSLWTGANCTGAPAGGAAVQAPTTGALTAATTSVTLTSTGSTTANYATDLTGGLYVCSDYTTVAANGVIAALTPTISAVYTKGSAAYTGDTLSANAGYALSNNGQTTDVRSYIPAGTAGYTSYVRVINTGSIGAVVTGQWLYEDGTTSTGAALSATALPAGGAKTYTSAQIEAAIGAPTATIGANRPRLRLTAPTSGLQAQSFFLNPDNSFATMHGSD